MKIWNYIKIIVVEDKLISSRYSFLDVNHNNVKYTAFLIPSSKLLNNY